jgi:CHAD domain-containing protein
VKPAKLFERWRDQQARLLKQLVRLIRRTRDQGSDEDVHELRVVSRRIRLLTRLGAAWYGKELSRAYRDWSRGLALSTDRLRDLDVALEWLGKKAAAEATVRALRGRRRRIWRMRRRHLHPLPAGLRRALSDTRRTAKREQRLARRCAKLTSRLETRLRADAPRFFKLRIEAQHDFRRLVRRWRYTRELELPDRSHRRDTRLAWLLRLQEALGERQNLLLADAAMAALPASNLEVPALRRQITAELEHWEQEIRRHLAALTD